mmetsp:Transcript_42531/g.83846  ORF Transcript_42531/g.83846 Transcript_42531/m.83846 type:complete len:206 (-) Transcript_42531:286-903(-)
MHRCLLGSCMSLSSHSRNRSTDRCVRVEHPSCRIANDEATRHAQCVAWPCSLHCLPRVCGACARFFFLLISLPPSKSPFLSLFARGDTWYANTFVSLAPPFLSVRNPLFFPFFFTVLTQSSHRHQSSLYESQNVRLPTARRGRGTAMSRRALQEEVMEEANSWGFAIIQRESQAVHARNLEMRAWDRANTCKRKCAAAHHCGTCS